MCECGGLISFKKVNSLESQDRITKYSCNECEKEYKPIHRRSREELVFSAMPKTDPNSGEEYAEFENCLSNTDNFYSDNSTPFERIDLEMAIEKLSTMIDKKTYVILKMVCLEGHSIKDAAKEVGLTGWAASMRLKKLDRYKIINDLLSDYFE